MILEMKKFLLVIFSLTFAFTLHAQFNEYELKENIHYYGEAFNQSDKYIKERCVLDVYYPTNIKNYPVIVWFHGGGLKGGAKEIPEALKEKGVGVVAVNYRLYPEVKSPKFIEDAATAVAWVFNNIKSFGGDTSLVFVSGYSAGGYLALMIGLDKSWLLKHNIDANRVAGIISLSGHTITHFTIREERKIPDIRPVVDSLAPLFHVRADAPPLILITGDRELELLGRYEENAYLIRMMKIAGHQNNKLYELEGYTHDMTYPAFPLLIKEVQRIIEERKNTP